MRIEIAVEGVRQDILDVLTNGAGATSSAKPGTDDPFVQIGGENVLLEMQGVIEYEGEGDPLLGHLDLTDAVRLYHLQIIMLVPC